MTRRFLFGHGLDSIICEIATGKEFDLIASTSHTRHS
jgi:hypothetical protein